MKATSFSSSSNRNRPTRRSSSHPPLTFNRWYHIAATLDDATGAMRIYTNGVLAAETNTSIRPFAYLSAGPMPPSASAILANIGLIIRSWATSTRFPSTPAPRPIRSPGHLLRWQRRQMPVACGTPVITQQPQSSTNEVNTTASFAVFATGNPAPEYQWFFAGYPLTGQTSASLQLDNIQPEQAGSYFVIVSNSFAP